jgi:hypothetical protein
MCIYAGEEIKERKTVHHIRSNSIILENYTYIYTTIQYTAYSLLSRVLVCF